MPLRAIGRRSNRGAVKTEYRGAVYASKSEASYARYLDWLIGKGDVSSWERQVKVPLVVCGVKVCDIIPDFLVTYRDGSTEYVEVKGHKTAVYNLKLKLFRAIHPKAKYRIVSAKEALAL